MTINNLEYDVPQHVRDLAYSYIPFGSEYVLYTSEYTNTRRVYDLLYKKPVSDVVHHVQIVNVPASYTGSASWLVSVLPDLESSYEGFDVQYEYYAYSSIPGEGVHEQLPTTGDLVCLMLIVCASLMVLKTVFGGVRLWRSRKPSVY